MQYNTIQYNCERITLETDKIVCWYILQNIYYCASGPLIQCPGLFENNKSTRACHTFVIRRYSIDL